MLSAAFGAAMEDMKRDRAYSGMRGWPWKTPDLDGVDFEWRGFDGHNVLMDTWTSPGSGPSESTLEHAAAYRIAVLDKYQVDTETAERVVRYTISS